MAHYITIIISHLFLDGLRLVHLSPPFPLHQDTVDPEVVEARLLFIPPVAPYLQLHVAEDVFDWVLVGDEREK